MGSNAKLLSRYLVLPQSNESVQVTYVWIDGKHALRSKTKTVGFVPQSASELPLCNFDGSSTHQSTGGNADLYLKAIRLYRDPFRLGNNKLALCETVTYDGRPTASNTRHSCNLVMNAAADQKPWFGIEQEYFMLDGVSGRLLGWPKTGEPDPGNVFAFFVGTGRTIGRDLVNIHYAACLYAGVKIDGHNSEAILGQWEYQIGPCEGISIGDDLVMSRYLLHRIAEDFHVSITFHPKPLPDLFFGNGGHTNFSTEAMRRPGGIAEINSAISKLAANHLKHIVKYDLNGGKDNQQRLVAGPCTEAWDKFSSGIGNRAASIRIPAQVAIDGCGYLEDRRPSGDLDPYLCSEMLVRTICLNE